MADLLVGARGRGAKRLIWTLAFGFVLGGLLTELCAFMPVSTPRRFLTTSVVARVAPFSIDIIGVDLTMGLGLSFNVLTLVGFGIVAFIIRSWI